jgi:hypothetical protein
MYIESASTGMEVHVGNLYASTGTATVFGVLAATVTPNGGSYAVNGYAEGSSVVGGRFNADSIGASAGDAWGVRATAHSQGPGARSYGIRASATTTSGSSYGVHATGSTYGVYCDGNLTTTGTKNFTHPHPTDASKEVRFVCLEGGESGCYFRGKGVLINGVALVPMPPEWVMVAGRDASNITVHLTAIQSFARLAAWEIGKDSIEVRGTEDCEFAYLVVGVRRAFESHKAIAQNEAFRPEVAGIPFGAHYPKAYRDMLVANGILNQDYTPNLVTASRNGWVLREPTPDEVARALESERAWLNQQANGGK